jgi:hypothetical protein
MSPATDDVGAPLTVTWSARPNRLTVYRTDGTSRSVRPAELAADPDLTGPVLVRHGDGPGLGRIVSIWARGPVIVESDYGYRTVVAGTHALTFSCWTAGSVTDHPAARVMRYAGGRPANLAAVIGNLFDPRWYTDPDRPGRPAAAEARLGLTPRWDRYRSVFRSCLTGAWMGPGEPAPHDFFGRLYRSQLGVRTESAAERFVGRYFLKCLLAAWTDALRPRGAEPLFDPALLFDARSVSAAARGD